MNEKSLLAHLGRALVADWDQLTLAQRRRLFSRALRSAGRQNEIALMRLLLWHPAEETQPVKKTKPTETLPAVYMGHKGGLARAASLSPQERSDIARRAAQARWKNRPD